MRIEGSTWRTKSISDPRENPCNQRGKEQNRGGGGEQNVALSYGSIMSLALGANAKHISTPEHVIGLRVLQYCIVCSKRLSRNRKLHASVQLMQTVRCTHVVFSSYDCVRRCTHIVFSPYDSMRHTCNPNTVANFFTCTSNTHSLFLSASLYCLLPWLLPFSRLTRPLSDPLPTVNLSLQCEHTTKITQL